MRQKITFFSIIIATVIAVSLIFTGSAFADDNGGTGYEDGGIVGGIGGSGGGCTTCGGGDGGGGGGGGGTGGSCGMTQVTIASTTALGGAPLNPGMCSMWVNNVDTCTGAILGGGYVGVAPCPAANSQVSVPTCPCETITVTDDGEIICSDTPWNLSARLEFPAQHLDVRPFPASLVRWPTAIRLADLPVGRNGETVSYIPRGGGSQASPRVGDWRNVTFELILRPATQTMEVRLPNVETLSLTPRGDTGKPDIFKWELPSHFAAGGGPLAGTIAGFDELPADMPVYAGIARTPYNLFWGFSYEEFTEDTNCESGRAGNGQYDCARNGSAVNNGHWETEYKWDGHTSGAQIFPYQVRNLPASLVAPPNSFWNNNVTLRRMDDNDRINNPQWARSWNWNGAIYWGVREGQAQIGWPGIP